MIKIDYSVNLFSENSEKLKQFLKSFYGSEINLDNDFSFEKSFENPIDMVELISTLIDNNEKFDAGIWISLDKNIYINITDFNLDKIIRYLFERYPY